MNRTIKAALVALAMASGTVAVGATAADRVVIGNGVIAFGYNDGYWDREHRWHEWRDRQEAARWREENREHYYAWKHDRDEDKGWREHDHWWDRH